MALERVAIAGAGIGGLTLALLLQRQGIAVTVLERRTRPQTTPTGLNLWSYAAAPLRDLGVDLASAGAPLERIVIASPRASRVTEFPVGAVSRTLGTASWSLERNRLMAALEAPLADGVLRRGVTVVDWREDGPDGAVLLTDQGEALRADLLVAADGIGSPLRQRLLGAVPLNRVGQIVWSGIAAPDAAGDLPADFQLDLWLAGGKAGIAPVGRGRWRWYLTQAADLPDRTALLARARAVHPWIAAAIAATPAEAVVRTEPADLPPLHHWFEGRRVLLGDAAHATTPFGGMGACSAIRDAVVLAECLRRTPETLTLALADYERRRKASAEHIVRDSRFKMTVATLRSGLLGWGRDLALGLLPSWQMARMARELVAGD